MPIQSVKLLPGIDIEKTPTLLEAGYSLSQLGRFREGLFQKIGGWQKFYPTPVSGIPKDIHPWQDLNNVKYLGVGTTTQLAIISSGTLTDITPQTKTTNPAPSFNTTLGLTTVTVNDSNITNVFTYDTVYFNTPVAVGGVILSGSYPVIANSGSGSYQITATTAATATISNGGAVPSFATVSGSATVTVTLAAHGLAVGDTISLPIATTVGGIVIGGTQSAYTVVTVPTVDTFTILASALATSSTSGGMNSGNVEFVYYLAAGPLPTSSGYGSQNYGVGGYGGAGSSGSAQTGSPITATNWSLDNWGSFIIGCPQGGAIYYWDPNGGFTTTQAVGTGPIFNGGCFVAMPQRQLIAWASTASLSVGVQQDALLVRFSDVDDFGTWAASSTNQAGSYRLPTGSKIIGALQGPQQGLLWTDLDLWAMNYIGPPLVYGFNKIGSSCGLIGIHAATQSNGQVFWMGDNNFFTLAGQGVQIIPCPIWDVVFQDLDTTNSYKAICGSNTLFNETIWFYPSASGGTGENDKYVKYNSSEGTWDYGTLGRTTWIDQSVLGNPLATTSNSLIYQHETTNDADGSPITSTMQTGYFVVDEGHNLSFIDWIWPDMKYGNFNGAQTANIQITILAANYPSDTPTQYGPYNMTSTTQYITTRIRARLIAIKIQSSDLGSFWRLGSIRLRFGVDGTR